MEDGKLIKEESILKLGFVAGVIIGLIIGAVAGVIHASLRISGDYIGAFILGIAFGGYVGLHVMLALHYYRKSREYEA
jgi:uncharacterized membrane protein YeaQ/YmgE (transglycosylase-associated protein family)